MRPLLLLALIAPATALADDPGAPPPEAAPEPASEAPPPETAPPVEAPAPPVDAPAPPAADAASLLGHAAAAVDDRLDDARREAAIAAMAELSDPRALPFLRAAALLDDPEIREAALRAAARFNHAEATDLGDRVARAPALPLEDRLRAVDLLGDLGRDDAGQALHRLAGAKGIPSRVRVAANRTFLESYPTLAASMAPPSNPVDGLGGVIGVAANGVAGGVLLSSVGAWGQLDEGTAIGAVGGSLIGLGTGWLYASGRPITRGQGLAYASGVGWGLSAGLMAQWAVVPADHPNIGDRERRNVGALLRVAGTGVGAGVGAWVMSHDPAAADVLEVDLAGYTGSQIAWGVSRLALGPDDFGPDPWLDPNGDRTYRLELARRDRVRTGATLIGVVAGLGVGAAARGAWDLQPGDALLAGVIAGESAWIGGWMPTAIDPDANPDGHVHTALHAGLAVGLLATALDGPTPARRGAVAAYGGVAGNLLGAGLPMLSARPPSDQTTAQVMLPLGAAGTIAGALLSERLDPDGGDWAMIGVGVPLATAQAAAIGAVLDAKGQIRGSQVPGIAVTTAGASSFVLMGIAPLVDPEPADMALLGAAAAWGTWYGGLTQVALDLDLQRGDDVLLGMVTADAFLIGGGVLISPMVDLDPKLTLGAQLGGVGGATLGALGAGLASNDAQTAAAGAVIGSTVGLAGGAAVTWFVRQKRGPSVATGLSRPRLPGVWTPTAEPTVRPDGSAVMLWGIRGEGW